MHRDTVTLVDVQMVRATRTLKQQIRLERADLANHQGAYYTGQDSLANSWQQKQTITAYKIDQ